MHLKSRTTVGALLVPAMYEPANQVLFHYTMILAIHTTDIWQNIHSNYSMALQFINFN